MPDMRFAPAPVLLARSGAGGLNQTSVRSHNERLVLDLLRREKTLSRFEIGQHTGLSAQTISVLVRALLKDGLLSEEQLSRGRVGPPTTPFSLNADGAFALGAYIGVRVIDVCLLDFRGNLRGTLRRPIGPDGLGDQVVALSDELLGSAPPQVRERALGVGLAINRVHWGAPAAERRGGWAPGIGLDDIENRITGASGLACFIVDDATSAAIGDILYGERADRFVYCHIGAEAQARVVLNGQAQVGFDDSLVVLPGLATLGRALKEARVADDGVWLGNELPPEAAGLFEEWAQTMANCITSAMTGLLAFLDVPYLVLVAPLAPGELGALAASIDAAFAGAGLAVPTAIGHNAQWAKASGAAASVMSARFSKGWSEAEDQVTNA